MMFVPTVFSVPVTILLALVIFGWVCGFAFGWFTHGTKREYIIILLGMAMFSMGVFVLMTFVLY